MSYLFLLCGVFLVIGLILFVRDLISGAQSADPECDYDEDDEEEIVAMGGQVDDSNDPPDTDEEPSEEEEPKS